MTGDALTVDKVLGAMRAVRRAPAPPTLLVSRHLPDQDGVLLIDWSAFAMPRGEWDGYCSPRDMIRLARMVRPRGWRPVRVWKRFDCALYRFEARP